MMSPKYIFVLIALVQCNAPLADENNITKTDQFLLQSGCDAFPNKLDLCEPYRCGYVDKYTGENLTKEIVGLKNGKCQASETVAKIGKIDCNYSKSYRKGVAQYLRDLDKIFGEKQVNPSIYSVDGKKTTNPIMDSAFNGVCGLSPDNPHNKALKNRVDFKIEWGEFSNTKDIWRMDIKITNNQKKMVIVDVNGAGKGSNWVFGSEFRLDEGESKTLLLEFDPYFNGRLALDIRKIEIAVYDCNKLSKIVEDKLCRKSYGFNGILSPWQVLEKEDKSGGPIKATSIHTKYFDYDSLVSAPFETSEREFNNIEQR